jgi:alginate O-acetyltransferase complex protein AlgI
MLLGGLWHGANWTFVAWGALHGSLLALTRAYHELKAPPWLARLRATPAWGIAGVLFTFHVVCAAWIFFRARSFGQARLMFAQLASGTTFHPNLHASVLAVLGIGLVCHFVPEKLDALLRQTFIRLPAPAQGLALFCVGFALREMASAEAVPFVYFQF